MTCRFSLRASFHVSGLLEEGRADERSERKSSDALWLSKNSATGHFTQ
jgi:hypothetical protein